jgi:hypothetical protein
VCLPLGRRTINAGGIMNIHRTSRAKLAIATIGVMGIGALTGCTSGSPASQHTALTVKSAGAYYESMTCSLDSAEHSFTVALLNAEQSTESTGPDLDALKTAALTYQKASRAAVAHLGSADVVWPASIRKQIVVLTKELKAMIQPLGEMGVGQEMTDEQAGYKNLPDNSGAAAAVKVIRAKLGLASDESSSCLAAKPAAFTTPPATGILIKGTGYSFHAPTAWKLPTRSVKADSYAISAKPDAKGVYDTVNVLVGSANSDSLDAQEQNGAEYLEQALGATQVMIRARVEIAGAEGVHVSSLRVNQGTSEWSEQYVVNHGGAGYTITFTFQESESQSTRDALAAAVLASWEWS